MEERIYYTDFCLCASKKQHKGCDFFFVSRQQQVVAHRPSDDASICLAIHMFCQFTSSDVKAIPAAFIETTYSITVTAKGIKQKKTPPLPFTKAKRADPSGNCTTETRGVDLQK